MGPTLQIVFDANEVPRLVAFWEQALPGYQVQPPPDGFATWEDFAREQGIPEDQWDGWGALIDTDGERPRIFFQRVPEGKTVKNRLHLDVRVGPDRREAEVARLLGLGATERWRGAQGPYEWATLADPQGNEFCVT